MATVAPGPIPTSPDFPVVWEQPDDERLFWMQDRMHFPDPLTPMDREFTCIIYRGFNQAAERYEMPIRFQVRHFNTYHYSGMLPLMGSPALSMQAERHAQVHPSGCLVMT